MVADRPLTIKLARRWDNLSMVRSRFRKGKPWLKTRSNKDGDLIIDTPALEWNHPILTATLQSCGQKPLSIDEMVKQVGCILVIYTCPFSGVFQSNVYSQFSTLKFFYPRMFQWKYPLQSTVCFTIATLSFPWRWTSCSRSTNSSRITPSSRTLTGGPSGGCFVLPFAGKRIAWEEVKPLGNFASIL